MLRDRGPICAGIGGVKALQRARVINLDRCRIVEADGELGALGVHCDAERLLAALRGCHRFEPPIRAITAGPPVIGHGIEPVRAIEGEP